MTYNRIKEMQSRIAHLENLCAQNGIEVDEASPSLEHEMQPARTHVTNEGDEVDLQE